MATTDMAAIVRQYKDATNNFRDWLMSTYNLVTGHRMFDMSTYDGKLKPALWNDMAEALAESPRKAARPPNFAFEQLARAIRFRIVARDHFRDNVVNFTDDPEVTNSYEQHDFFISVLENIWEVLGGPEWEINRGLATLELQTFEITPVSDTESVSTNIASDFDLNTSGSATSKSSHSDTEAGDPASDDEGTSNSVAHASNNSKAKSKKTKNTKKKKNKNKNKNKNKKKKKTGGKNSKKASHKGTTKQQVEEQTKQNQKIEALISQVINPKPTPEMHNAQQESFVIAVLDLFSLIKRLHETQNAKWANAAGPQGLKMGGLASKNTIKLIQQSHRRLCDKFKAPRSMELMLGFVVSGSTIPSPLESLTLANADVCKFFDISTYKDLCLFVDAHQLSITGGRPRSIEEAIEFIQSINGQVVWHQMRGGFLVKVRRALALTALETMMGYCTHSAIVAMLCQEQNSSLSSPLVKGLLMDDRNVGYSRVVLHHGTVLQDIRTWTLSNQRSHFRTHVKPHHVAFVRMLVDDFGQMEP